MFLRAEAKDVFIFCSGNTIFPCGSESFPGTAGQETGVRPHMGQSCLM